MRSQKRRSRIEIAFGLIRPALQRLNVFRLPALGAFGHVKLHCLTFLQALKTARLDRREVHKNVFATLAADKTVAFSVVEPLYCSLFHVCTCVPYLIVTLEGVGRNLRRLLAVEARTAHDRFGLTHTVIVRGMYTISKPIRSATHIVTTITKNARYNQEVFTAVLLRCVNSVY